MIDAQHLQEMPIEELKSNFFDLMSAIVATDGDKQEEETEQEETSATTN